MPFSDDFHVHKYRGTKVHGLQGTPNKSGVVAFTKSTDHASVQSYEIRIYAMGGSTVLLSRNIGKPIPYADGTILTDMSAEFATLSAGNYTAKVAAISPGGTSESTGDDFALPIP